MARRPLGFRVFCVALATSALAACGGGGGSSAPPIAAPAAPASVVTAPASGSYATAVASPTPKPAPTPATAATGTPAPAAGTTGTAGIRRSGFLGAFFRPEGAPPFGVFDLPTKTAPNPYPTPGAQLVGSNGYCDEVAANGASISGSYPVDAQKLADIVNLGVKWTRMPAPQFFDDVSHVFGAGQYTFGDFDSAQCATLARNGITPVVGLEAGPVQYDAVPGTLSPQQVSTYATATDFGTWCGAVAAHERAAFPSVTRYSLPGNEVNTNPQLFPGGNPQIAAYSRACYAAIKAANPAAFVYGFELNMDGGVDAPGFVRQLAALGCGVGTCYDGIAMHLSLRYPIPAASTPCYPNAGGDYGMQCVADIQAATGAAVHVLISETGYPVPGYVPDEATKAKAVAAAFPTFAANPAVDGVNYANVDECGLYPTGYFAGGCLIDTTGNPLPAYQALRALAVALYQ
jgi:hypothetical protein